MIQENSYCQLQGLPADQHYWLREELVVLTQSAQMQAEGWRPPDPGDGAPAWDGKIRLYEVKAQGEHGRFQTGLLPRVLELLWSRGILPNIQDNRVRPDSGLPESDISGEPLRDYQRAAVEAAEAAGRGVWVMSPRAGKTRCGIELARRLWLPTVWLAPTRNICTQTVRAFDRHLGQNVAVHHAGADWRRVNDKLVIVMTYDTARDLPQEFWDSRQVLFVDEVHHCLDPSQRVLTLSGWRAISTICVGDMVASHDGTGALCWRPVRTVWKRPGPETMLKIRTTAGTVVVTDEHKVYTPSGKVRAGDLRAGSRVHVLKVREGDQGSGACDESRTGLQGTEEADFDVPVLLPRGPSEVGGGTHPVVFRTEPFGSSRGASSCDGDAFGESGIPGIVVSSDDAQERRAHAGGACATGGDAAETHHRGAFRAVQSGGGERAGSDLFGGCCGAGVVPFGVRTGADCPDGDSQERGGYLVSGRLRAPDPENTGGDRRHISQRAGGARYETRRLLPLQAVAGAASACESGDPRISGRGVLAVGEVLDVEVIPARSSEVFDLEVAEHHNYVVEGLNVSNSAADSFKAINRKIDHIYFRIGMTGTHFRSNGDDLAMHAFLSGVICRVTSDFLVSRGYLVPASVALIPVPEGERFRSGNHAEAVSKGIALHEFRQQAAAWAASVFVSRRKKVVVLVSQKVQGDDLVRRLRELIPDNAAGTEFRKVEFVSTNRPSNVCDRVIRAFAESDEVQVLVGTSMIGEGTDLPPAECLVYAHGGKAEVGHRQAVYRVCTAAPAKRRAYIVDFADRHHKTLIEHSVDRTDHYLDEPTFTTTVLDRLDYLPGWLDHHGR